MNRRTSVGPIVATAAALVVHLATPGPLAAQDARAFLQQGIAAYQNFDFEAAVGLLRRGLDPVAQPRDSLWVLGAQYLVDYFWTERGEPDEAGVWARWAVRVMPTLRADPLEVPSEVVALFDSLRTVVAQDVDGETVATDWVWPDADPGSGSGRLEIRAERDVTVTVVGQATLLPGQSLPLRGGVYRLRAEARDFAPVEVAREILPGIITTVAFELRPAVVAAEPELVVPTADTAAAQAAERERPQPQEVVADTAAQPSAQVTAQRKKGFPWLVAILGAAGVGAGTAAYFLLSGEPAPEPTGNLPVTITIPE